MHKNVECSKIDVNKVWPVDWVTWCQTNVSVQNDIKEGIRVWNYVNLVH